jgi:hypothetical protein
MRTVLELVILFVVVMVLMLSCGAFVDYWNGTARSDLIFKQTGIRYTWREAAQIKTMYDQQNVRISFDSKQEK